MSTMLERVADALEPKCFGNGFTKRLVALELARAAIEAMREMTDEMVEAFAEAGFDAREAAREENRRRKLPHPSAIAECQWVPQAFRAAIEAALSQDTHSLPLTPEAANAGIGAPPPSGAGTNSDEAP